MTTEQDYLELANDCKNRIEEKNKEIFQLKKELKRLKRNNRIISRNILKAKALLEIHSKYNIMDDIKEIIEYTDLDLSIENEETDSEYEDMDYLTHQVINELSRD
tara:strand:+ start:688 stop:1002 length:315 start_codon:yes stop_codon:yes gene_type:complete